MKREIGKWSRSITAIGLAIGISFSGAASMGVLAQDNDDRTERAYLYEGNTSDLANGRMIVEIDDLDDFYDDIDDDRDDRDDNNSSTNTSNNTSTNTGGDDDWDDDDWDDDDWDDDDWDDDDWDDDWDDDDWDDDWDDDDWDDDDWDDDDWDDDDWDDDYDDDDWDDDDDDWDDFAGGNMNLSSQASSILVHSLQVEDDDDHWAVLGDGQERPEGLLTTEEEIDDDYNFTVQSLVDGEYMIVVHEDGDIESPIIAAGNISGMVEDGAILVELEEVEESGFEGRAHIQPEDADDENELEVTVGIFPVGTVAPLNTPAPRG